MFFDRVSYKERGKEIVKANFWILVLASFVANLLGGQSSFNSSSGGGGFSAGGSSSNIESLYDTETGEINTEVVKALTVYFTAFTVVFLVILAISIVYSVFVGSIIQVGKKKIFLENVDQPNTDFALVFSGFTG